MTERRKIVLNETLQDGATKATPDQRSEAVTKEISPSDFSNFLKGVLIQYGNFSELPDKVTRYNHSIVSLILCVDKIDNPRTNILMWQSIDPDEPDATSYGIQQGSNYYEINADESTALLKNEHTPPRGEPITNLAEIQNEISSALKNGVIRKPYR